MDPSQVERAAMRGGTITVAAQVVKAVISAAGTLFLTRALSPDAFGLVGMIVAVTGITDLLKDYGLSSATIQRPELRHEEVSALFWINAGIGLVLGLLTLAAAPAIAAGYGRPELFELTCALAGSSVLGGLSVQHIALLRRELQIGRVAAIDVGAAVISTIAAVAAAYQGYGAWALIVRQLVRLFVQALLSWLLCPWRPSMPARTDVRELVRFGAHVSGFQLMNYLERNLDNMLIGRFGGAHALGLYEKAYEVMRTPLEQVVNPATSVAVPALSRLLDQPDRYRVVYTSIGRLVALALTGAAPILIYTADFFIPAILGHQWSDSVPIFQCLAAGLLVKPLLATTGWLFVSQGRGQDLWRWGVVGAVIAIASFIVGLRWGAIGVAAAYSIADIFIRAPLLLWWVSRTGPVTLRDLLACQLPAMLCAAVVGAVCLALDHALPLPADLRMLIASPIALVAGVGSATLTKNGRDSLRSGLALIRGMRKGAS
jgi:PST family polysaccharide transporter